MTDSILLVCIPISLNYFNHMVLSTVIHNCEDGWFHIPQCYLYYNKLFSSSQASHNWYEIWNLKIEAIQKWIAISNTQTIDSYYKMGYSIVSTKVDSLSHHYIHWKFDILWIYAYSTLLSEQFPPSMPWSHCPLLDSLIFCFSERKFCCDEPVKTTDWLSQSQQWHVAYIVTASPNPKPRDDIL